jgi:hypothetical protein
MEKANLDIRTGNKLFGGGVKKQQSGSFQISVVNKFQVIKQLFGRVFVAAFTQTLAVNAKAQPEAIQNY